MDELTEYGHPHLIAGLLDILTIARAGVIIGITCAIVYLLLAIHRRPYRH